MTSAASRYLEPDHDESDGQPTGRDTAGVIAPPPLVYLGGLAAGFALRSALPATPVPPAVRWPVGGALLATGGTLMGSFVRAFARAGTPVSPYTASTALVTSGPYRISRNPAYLGMALVYAGIAVSAEALWALAPLPAVLAVIDRGVIAREERYLDRRLGDEYRRYKQRKRRWL
jgi:protein-S-isoprenylcysteine O-methyltransferase Ste14